MLALDHITMQFGGRSLFEDVTLLIGPHDRIGLVGSNGTGKSTLMRIIAGVTEAESGRINKAHYVTVGYLPQDGIAVKGLTLYDEVATAFEDILLVQQEIDEAHNRLASLDPSSEEYADVLEVFGELHHKLEDLDAFRMKSKIEQVLAGLGFGSNDFARQTEEFSGGWQMRIELAKLLLKEPSALLLDEPTNHLDIESLQWLEEYLQHYNGAVVLVSHDRAFLDALTRRTFAISRGELEEYNGNYSFYEKERITRRELLLNAQKNQQQQIKQTQEFIERFRYKATKARQVQSRIKQLEKMDTIEVENDEEEIHFRFPAPQSSGRIALELKGVRKTYGPIIVFNGLDLTIERGERIAVVGVNGAGKSTLSRILAGVEMPDGGERRLGHNVFLSYFAQHQAEELDPRKEVLDIVDEVAVGDVRTKLRTLLGAFLFHGDDVFKKVGVLSGGEKSRLALAKMLLLPSNVLVMDEPTNHLDMRSKKVLQEALEQFEGTAIIVSHDRAFLDPFITRVFEVSRHGVRSYLGTLSEYLAKKRAEQSGLAERARHIPGSAPATDKERRRIEAEERRERSSRLRPLRTRLDAAEREVARLESKSKELEAKMADADFYRNGDEAKKTAHDYREAKLKLEEAYRRWSEASVEYERAMNDVGP